MPRPSLKTVRREEILEAFAFCAARFGLEGATQERIADRAGVKRSILRHYLGNRDEMTDALIDYMAVQFDEETEALRLALPETGRVEALIRFLTEPETLTSSNTVLAFQAVVAASDRYPKARRKMLASVSRFLELVEQEFAAAYPKAPKAQVEAAAFGLVSLYFNLDALAPLRPPKAWRASSRLAARTLVQTLKESET